MTQWPSTKARLVLAALIMSSHFMIEKSGPRMLARIAKRTGFTPEDL